MKQFFAFLLCALALAVQALALDVYEQFEPQTDIAYVIPGLDFMPVHSAALPEQLAGWYATLLHYPTRGVGWALTAPIYYCKISLYTLYGKPPYQDGNCRAS
jgi:hypothetical protein